jgi:hypothetical protein
MTEYTKRMLVYCTTGLALAIKERNSVLIAYYEARIEELNQDTA